MYTLHTTHTTHTTPTTHTDTRTHTRKAFGRLVYVKFSTEEKFHLYSSI